MSQHHINYRHHLSTQTPFWKRKHHVVCVSLISFQTNNKRKAAEVLSVFNVLCTIFVLISMQDNKGLLQYQVQIIKPIKPSEWSFHKQTQRTAF